MPNNEAQPARCPMRHRPLIAPALALCGGVALGWQLGAAGAFRVCAAVGFAAALLLFSVKRERAKNLGRLFAALVALFLGVLLVCARMRVIQGASPLSGTLTGTVVSAERTESGQYLFLRNTAVNNTAVSGGVRLFSESAAEFHRGETVQVASARLTPPSAPTNPGAIDRRISLWSRNARYSAYGEAVTSLGNLNATWWDRLIAALLSFRATLENALQHSMSAEAFGSVRGLLFGDVSGMEESWLDAYRATGIAHVLAVSGLNVALLGGIFAWLFAKLKMGRWACVPTLALMAVYCVFAGFSASVVRAAVMMALALILRFFGERPDTPSVLAAAAAFSVLLNPFMLLTPGFLLSFGAVAGILALDRPLRTMLLGKKPKKVGKALAGAASVSVAAQLGTLPAQVAFFNAVPVLSLPVNLAVLPLSTAATVCGLLAALLGSLFAPLALPFAWLAEGFVRLMAAVALFVSRLPFAVLTVGDPHPLLYTSFALFCVAVAIPALQVMPGKKRVVSRLVPVVLAVLLAVGGLIPMVRDARGAELTMLDVGEGDALFLRDGSHAALLDGGRLFDRRDDGQTVLLPFLRSRGVTKLDALLVSHPHADHCGGLVTVIENIPVGCLVVGDPAGAEEAYLRLLDAAKRRGVPVVTLKEGDVVHIGSLSLTALSRAVGGDNANEASLVFSGRYGKIGLLLTGDADGSAEKAYLDRANDIDILKVAHHGSKYGTSAELLTRTSPSLALISAGRGNTYGHPAPETLLRLLSAGAAVYRTDQSGAVTVRMRDDQYWVTTFWKN